MDVFDSPVFWVIIGALIIIMAIIGKLAEGTKFDTRKKAPKKDKIEDIVPEVEKAEDSYNPSAWTNDVPVADERQETVYDTSVNNWNAMPSADNLETETTNQNMVSDAEPVTNQEANVFDNPEMIPTNEQLFTVPDTINSPSVEVPETLTDNTDSIMSEEVVSEPVQNEEIVSDIENVRLPEVETAPAEDLFGEVPAQNEAPVEDLFSEVPAQKETPVLDTDNVNVQETEVAPVEDLFSEVPAQNEAPVLDVDNVNVQEAEVAPVEDLFSEVPVQDETPVLDVDNVQETEAAPVEDLFSEAPVQNETPVLDVNNVNGQEAEPVENLFGDAQNSTENKKDEPEVLDDIWK